MQNERYDIPVSGSFATCHWPMIIVVATFFAFLPPTFAKPSVLQSMEREFQEIVKSVQPWVVEVIATCKPPAQKTTAIEKEFFAGNLTPVDCYQKIGSGVIIDSAGRIVTTAAVVEKADQIEVVFADGQRTPGELLGTDTLMDIAVLSVKGESIPQASIGDSDQIDTGSWVITVGSSYGHSPTFSLGIVSDFEILPNRPFYDAIKINAPMNPGNSGGAVVNMSGELVGVITAALAEPYVEYRSSLLDLALELSEEQSSIWHTTAPNGQIWMRSEISFAIPMKTVAHISDQLTQYGKVSRGWLGVKPEPEGEQSPPVGVRLAEVFENTPAQKAAIKPHDVIMEFNSQPVRTSLELTKLVANTPPQTRVTVKIRRDGQLLQREVVLGERKSP